MRVSSLSNIKNKLCCIGILTIAVLAFACPSLAQTGSSVVNEINGTKPTGRTPASEPRKPKKPRKPTVIKTSNSSAGEVNNNSGGLTGGLQNERINASFLTGAPAVEILLDGAKIGVSDAKGKLGYFLALGKHEVIAHKNEEDLFEPLTIVVSNTQKVFDISSKVATGIDKLKQTTAKVEVPVSPDDSNGNAGQKSGDANVETSNNAAAIDSSNILEVYTDPKTTETITVEDWQRVYQQTENTNIGLHTFAQGQVELANKSYALALNLFDAAKSLMPENAAVYYGLGNAQVASSDNSGAIEAFRKALSIDSRMGLAHLRLGEVYQSQGKTALATQQFNFAEGLGVDVSKYRRSAGVKIKSGKCAPLIKELEETVKVNPSAESYIRLAGCYRQEERTPSAIDALKEAIKLDNKSAMANFMLGSIYLEEKEYSDADKTLSLALGLDPGGQTIDLKELKKMIEKARKRSR